MSLHDNSEGYVRKKRRLAVDSDTSDDECSQVEKARSNRELIEWILELPLDLVHEIFGRLDPIDLLNLVRSLKDLRKLFMSRSTALIWKQARLNIDGLPDCPSDLNEPQYANLAFSNNCHFCLRNLGSLHICWEARLKTCSKCLSTDAE
ncbi:hypothetical protein GALMADRAFT_235021 [Galerina marginata CBS 339.88]|uniref:F-box domain-containing protein n=1 Tax=Galerina marginata (strain CBS 339.88) TaxID=685588 RepID=A0A067U396_GALM3|nr:hypothetical protein GALMADRAFT_235021 [Galerina marginata CBS 339.88]